MSLSCNCGFDNYEWYYIITNQIYSHNTISQCRGCGRDIQIGEEIRLELKNEYDEYGDEIESVLGPICEQCGDLYDSLTEHGFCVTDDGPGWIKRAHKDYLEMKNE